MGKNKLGRNELCWCGSGQKYKKCHLDRAQDQPMQHWQAAKAMREKFTQKLCLAPEILHKDCSEKIIKAHTVSKSSSLKAIALDGHVLGLSIGLENFVKNNAVLRPELIGINKASTFTGFCQKHDNELFACLEKGIFRRSNEQCFKLAFRSFSREYYTKSAMVDMKDVMSKTDKGKPLHRQYQIQEQANFLDFGAQIGARDNRFHKEKFDLCISTDEYSDIRACVIQYADLFPVQVSGSTNPDFDFSNIKIQDLSDLEIVPDLISFTSFHDGEKSFIVLSWMKHCHESCRALVDSLLAKPRKDMSTYLVQFIFSSFENFYISPAWWNSISDNNKEIIVELSLDNVNPMVIPHGKSISNLLLNVSLPESETIDHVNWAS